MQDLREKFENLKFVRGCFRLGVIEYKDFGGYTLDGEPYFWLNGAYEMYKHLEKDLRQIGCSHIFVGKSENQRCMLCGKE